MTQQLLKSRKASAQLHEGSLPASPFKVSCISSHAIPFLNQGVSHAEREPTGKPLGTQDRDAAAWRTHDDRDLKSLGSIHSKGESQSKYMDRRKANPWKSASLPSATTEPVQQALGRGGKDRGYVWAHSVGCPHQGPLTYGCCERMTFQQR